MTAECAADRAAQADMASARFRAGLARGYWRVHHYAFPLLTMTVVATEPDGAPSTYGFRFDLGDYPNRAPEARIWDIGKDAPLEARLRPKGSARLVEAFKVWGSQTVYRPWERHSGEHNNWKTTYPMLAWNASRDLTFVLGDLHGLLASNGMARRAG